MKKKNIKPLIVLSSVLLFACGGNNHEETTEVTNKDTLQHTGNNEQNNQQEVFYQIPSPDEMFDFIKNGGLAFQQELLLPVDNIDRYNTQLSQSLVFGIYSADLAYTAAFEEYQTSLKYFGTVQKIAEQLGISSAYDASTAERIKNNLNNADSLVKVTGDTYFSVVDYLEQNNEESKLGAIAAAGWLESMYIVLNSINDNADDDVLQRIKDQKLTFDNLYDYLQQHNNNQQVEEIIKMMEPVHQFFSEIEENTEAKTTFTKKGGKFILGGDDTVAPLSAEQINELKELINKIRTEIVEQNA